MTKTAALVALMIDTPLEYHVMYTGNGIVPQTNDAPISKILQISQIYQCMIQNFNIILSQKQ